MARICENFKIGENGQCENYIGKGRKGSCSQNCKVNEAKSNKKSEMRKLLDNQIIGISVPYETEAFRKIRKLKK